MAADVVLLGFPALSITNSRPHGLPLRNPTSQSMSHPWLPVAGGIWDTKHLVKCLPEVANCLESTSLGPLYEALGTADALQPEVRRTRKIEALKSRNFCSKSMQLRC